MRLSCYLSPTTRPAQNRMTDRAVVVPDRAQRWMIFAISATLVARFWLAYVTPISGDEAYFVLWGRNPDFGFYDHPPMVGWILSLLLSVGDHPIWLRLPVILLPAAISALIYSLLRPTDAVRAAWAASLFTLAPVNALNIFITTDAPLVLFTVLSGLSYQRARLNDRLRDYVLAGIFLGLAFWAKYFSVLLGAAYLVHYLAGKKTPANSKGLLVLIAAALPFLSLNIYWNMTHCWDNLMFNLYNRNEAETFAWHKPALYGVMLLYLATPAVLLHLWRARAKLPERTPSFTTFVYLLMVPLAIFLMLSTIKVIGLHWLLSFYPFFFILIALALHQTALAKCVKFMAWFTAAHLAAIAAFAATPVEMWHANPNYDVLVFLFKRDVFYQALAPYEREFHFAADRYTPASVLSFYFHDRRPVMMFGEGNYHARQDDILTDFRKLNGQNIALILTDKPELARYQPYFGSIETKTLTVARHTYYMVLGYRFDYRAYRDVVLRTVKEKYYRIPNYLPVTHCYYCERYFPQETCR